MTDNPGNFTCDVCENYRKHIYIHVHIYVSI